MRLLIASDAHGDVNATRLLRESYALERPDFLVHLGDMVDGQTANASASLRALLAAAPGPRWLILGNHDEEALPASEILRIAGQPRASRVLQNDAATLHFLDRRDWWSVVGLAGRLWSRRRARRVQRDDAAWRVRSARARCRRDADLDHDVGAARRRRAHARARALARVSRPDVTCDSVTTD